MKNTISFLLSKKYYILAVLILGFGGYFLYAKNNKNNIEYVKLFQGSLISEVSVAGKVVASHNVDLSFETGGTVASVSKDVGSKVSLGDIIVSLDTSELFANLEKAKADLAGEQAKLDQLQNNDSLATEVTTAKRKLADSIVDGFTSADDAIRNKVDQFFTDADTMNPKITFAFNDYDLKEKINGERIVVEETLNKWSKLNSSISETNVTSANADTARGYLSSIKTFLNDVSRAVNNFETNNTLPQSTIDKYKSDVALARTNINTALSTLTSAQEGIRSTSSDKPVQEARVNSALANISSIKAQIEKSYIKAPFAGLVSIQNAKVGEAVSAHTNLVSLISENYEIEAYVPELNISGVTVGDATKVSLDAFGPSVTFDAKVISIDPAETVKDGVATYKVRFAFQNADDRVRPGMTANIKIETAKRDNVSILPMRAVFSKDNKNYVEVATKDDPIQKEIQIGEKDSKGNVEVLSGLSPDDKVYLNPTP